MTLRTKIIATVGVVLMISIGISTAVVTNLQRSRIIESKSTDVKVLGGIILNGIETAMAAGKTEEVQKVMESLGKSPELKTLRIISTDGYILKSHKPAEIGLKSSKYELYTMKRESGKDAQNPAVTGGSVVYFAEVANKTECYGCHSDSIATNGIIEVEYDLTRSLADIVSIKRVLMISNIITILIVAAILGIMLSSMILAPLSAFMRAIKDVEGGDWDRRLRIRSRDEVGALGKAFNTMLDEVQTLYKKSIKKEKEISKVKVELEHKAMLEELNTQLQYKVREVETANKAVLSLSKEVKIKNVELEKMVERLKRINEVGRVLSSIINPAELLKIVIKTTAETLRVERGSLYVNRDPDTRMTLVYNGSKVVESPDLSNEQRSLYNEMLTDGKSIMLNENPVSASQPTLGSGTSAIGVPLRMKGQIIGGMLLENKQDSRAFTHDDLELLDTMANQAIVAMENAWLYDTVKNNYFGTIQSLVNALEASDRYTKGHSDRVRLLGLELCRFIGIDFRELEVFEHAAILHDIGKIGIDTSVLNKEDKLTHSEFSLIRAHPIIGDEILGPIGTLQGVRTAILQHHERYDGKGYPYGLSGEEITLKARILSVIDTFDAMITDRPYRKALPLTSVLDELKKGTGNQFDPAVVNAFLEMVRSEDGVLDRCGYASFLE